MISAPKKISHARVGFDRRAFTLLEVLTVLTIIALVTSAVVGAGRFATESSRTARAKAELAAISAALAAFKANFGDYPRTEDISVMMQALIGRRDPDLRAAAVRPFLETHRFSFLRGVDPYQDEKAQLLDPWERPYHYRHRAPSGGKAGESHAFVLFSTGPDGVDAGVVARDGTIDWARAARSDDLVAGISP